MNSGPTVIVSGASSQLGVFLLPRLLAAGYEVSALSRRAPATGTSTEAGLRWLRPEAIDATRPAALVSCGPITLAADLVEARKAEGRAVVFSTSSVRTKSESRDRAEREKVAAITAAEERLKTSCRERGIALALIRPTLIYGCGLDSNLSLLLRLGERTGLIPVSRNAHGLRQPVHADDLSTLATSVLGSDFGPFFEGEAPGGSTLTYRSMVEKVAECGKRGIRVLELPEFLLSAFVRMASNLGPWKGINPEMVSRQAGDMVFDGTRISEQFDWNPRPFDPTPEDFSIPPKLEQCRLPM